MAYNPPPVGYAQQQPNVVYKMAQPVDFQSPYPQNMACSGCGQSISTYTTEVTGSKTKWGMGAFFCGLGILFFWIPLVVRSFKDIEHRCPRCNSFLGTFRPSPRGAKIAFGILTCVNVGLIVLYVVIIAVVLGSASSSVNRGNY